MYSVIFSLFGQIVCLGNCSRQVINKDNLAHHCCCYGLTSGGISRSPKFKYHSICFYFLQSTPKRPILKLFKSSLINDRTLKIIFKIWFNKKNYHWLTLTAAVAVALVSSSVTRSDQRVLIRVADLGPRILVGSGSRYVFWLDPSPVYPGVIR